MKDDMRTFRWIMMRVRRFIPALIAVSFIRMAASYLSVKYALVMRDVIDAAVGGSGAELKRAVIIMAVFAVLSIVLRLLNRNISRVTGFKMNRMWKTEMTDKILDSDCQSVSRYHSGDLLSRMTSDVQAVDTGLISFLPGVLALITRLITAVVVLGSMAPRMTAVICIGGITVMLVSSVFRRRLKKLHKQVQEAGAAVTSFIQETLERLNMVQALEAGDEIRKREDALLEQRYRVQLKHKNLGLAAGGGLSAVCIAAEFGIILWSILQLRAGLMTFGTLTAMVTLFTRLQTPFVSMSSVLPQYVAMMGSAERIREIFDLKADDSRNAAYFDTETLYRHMDSITGKDMWFRYEDAPSGEYVIRQLDFDIPKGSFCAVSGGSGIGKTTLMKMLLGMYAPCRGSLKAGTAEITRKTRSLFAYVPQGNMLLSGSIKENLLLTKPDASDEDIAAAVYIADMEGFIAELPDGLDTVIGENALGISEGQAQRVSIARAVLSGRPVILLDEATSALDAETERRVLQRIRSLEGKTVIAVTHRPAAQEMSDCVIRM